MKASSTRVSKTQSVGALSKRDKSALKPKKHIADDEFNIAYNLNCEAAGLQKRPTMTSVTTEPIPWVSFLSMEKKTAPRLSNVRVRQSSLTVMPLSPKKTNSTEELPAPSESYDRKEIIAVYNHPEQENQINMLIYRHFPMENDIMGVLQKTFVKFSSLRVLRLEYCNLTPEQIKAVKLILRQNENITDLSLDGNPIKRQNYYLLLKNTKLVSFSLKFCKLDDIGAARISNCLHFPEASDLIILDLASNFIGDDGCQSIANALRTNRSLTHLSLANNFIGDQGCVALMSVLKKFSLNHDEVYLRRRMNMDYLLRLKIASQERKSRLIEVPSLAKYTNSSKFDKRKPSLSRTKKERSSVVSTSSFRKIKRKSTATEFASDYIITVPKDQHPYMHECTFEMKQVFCRGNFTLTYLNLEYNRIYCSSVDYIRDVLLYQISERPVNFYGLRKLHLNGNPIMECNTFEVVVDLMDDGASRKVSDVSAVHSVQIESKKSIRKTASAN